MLNYEKYKDEIENYDVTPTIELDCYLCNLRKLNCDDANDNCSECLKESLKFLFSEYKEPIKLTIHEKYILESIDKKYQFIARDKNFTLCIFDKEPSKCTVWWDNTYRTFVDLSVFKHLFKFIKWEDEEPTNIQEILNNYEVIEDE